MSDEDWDYYNHRVLSVRSVTPAIKELWLAPTERAMRYRPGEYVLLEDSDGLVPPRSYSVANAPRDDGRISLLITRYPGGITSAWVHDELSVGGDVVLTGPYGTFVLDEARTGPVLLLGAGSGLAPLLAIAETLESQQPGRKVTLAFSGRTAADQIDADRFEAWARSRENFQYLVTLTREPDAPCHELLPKLLQHRFDDLSGWEVFAAGPTGFVVDCAAEAIRLGADPTAVHTEEFFGDPVPWAPATATGRQE